MTALRLTALVLLALTAGVLLWKNLLARTSAIYGPNPIAELIPAQIGGKTQCLLIRGEERHHGAADAAEELPAAPPLTSRARILIVEDDDLVRAHTCRIVRSLGYEVEVETRAIGALHRLMAGEPFDLLLSDVVMPGGVSGRQLAGRVRSLRPNLPVLLVSGHAEEIAAESDGRSDPGIGFLNKPFHKSDLANRLANMLPD